jgi:glycosyltransferase involved in cell wall biosynthesis
MDAADFLMLPAKGEGLPGVIMEAAAASKPAVASNTPCIPDLVVDAKTGFLCEIGNAAEFANAAEKLIQNKGLRQRFGSAAHEHIQAYDWKVILGQYERFYRGLLRSE